MRVLHLAPGEDEARWDAFVGPRATAVTDSSAWRRVVAETYGLKSHFLAAEEDGRLVGTLGLFQADHAVFGRYLSTAAFGNDGGFHFENDAARDALLAEAKSVADRENAEYLLIRAREPVPGFVVDDRYRTAVLDLSGGAEKAWNEALDRKTRNQVRHGQKEGFAVAAGHDQADAFYEVFNEHMRDLGSPAPPRAFYDRVIERLGDRAEFLVVRDGSALVAGALVFWTNGVATNYHTVALKRYNPRCPNYLLYWRMIEDACRRGCASFDMGRSEADGPNLAFKLNWGARPVPLYYSYRLRAGAALPRKDPRDPLYRLPIAVWKRLPLFAAKILGPRIIAGIL